MAKKSFKTNTAELFISEAEAQTQEQTKEPVQDPADGFVVPKGYMLVRENKTARMQLLVRPTLKEKIMQEADRQHMSMNELFEKVFEEYLEGKDKE
jgi:uridine kinase